MQIKNNYDKNVFNGDIGSISKIDTEERTLALNFDGNVVDYDATELGENSFVSSTLQALFLNSSIRSFTHIIKHLL